VCPHRHRRQHQALCDLRGWELLAYEVENLPFAARQPLFALVTERGSAAGGAIAELLDHLADELAG
jgi:hypothetical protein